MLVKKLSQHGNSYALIIDKPILDLLDIDEKTPLELVCDGNVLIISPRPTPRRRRFLHAMKETNEKYGDMLKRLAES